MIDLKVALVFCLGLLGLYLMGRFFNEMITKNKLDYRFIISMGVSSLGSFLLGCLFVVSAILFIAASDEQLIEYSHYKDGVSVVVMSMSVLGLYLMNRIIDRGI